MPNFREAEEHLRVIRSLMEKATIYRALSAPGALVAGSLSLANAVIGITHHWLFLGSTLKAFCGPWIVTLILTSVTNLLLLTREARTHREAWVPERMLTALRAMAPALIAGGACTFLIDPGNEVLVAVLWILLYGVALLAMRHFAPPSLRVLGWTFLLFGGTLLVINPQRLTFGFFNASDVLAHALMGLTFGLFHLVYAASTWTRLTAAVAVPKVEDLPHV